MDKYTNSHEFRRMICLLLIVVSLCTAVTVPASAATDETRGYGKKTIMVSLGDSFSAGEGIEPFYDQNLSVSAKVNSEDWLAHRSINSWPGMLTLPGVSGVMSKNRNSVWYFAAASGATTDDLRFSQKKEYLKFDANQICYSGEKDLPYQLSIFSQIPKNETDYVTMTIGGNDADFTGIIKKAVISSSYHNISKLRDDLNDKIKLLGEGKELCNKIIGAYQSVSRAAGKRAKIIIAGYPQLFSPQGGETITAKEAQEINSAITTFNNALESYVDSCKKYMNIYFADVETAFLNNGGGAYSENALINDVDLNQKGEDLKDLDPLGGSAYSMHPNLAGAKVYAQCVQKEIDDIESAKEYKTVFRVSAKDAYGNACGDYDISIQGTYREYFKKKEYHETFHVDSANPKTISLPTGEYTITISQDKTKYSKKINVTSRGKRDELIFSTRFNYKDDGDGDITIDTPDRVTSDERDVVLVLDVSGSMSGEPMEQTKRAARNFIDTVLQQDASIGLVTYDNYADMVSDFTIDGEYLKSCVDRLRDGGGTNIDSGLSVAQDMLRQSNAKKKIIVLMSDGLPNDGREGQQLIDFAEDIQNENVLIYTLGFFSAVGDKSEPQALMEGIASEGCHYEVDDADNLVFFFQDMADQINGTRYIYIRIACPVEVTVTHNGETLTSDGQTKSQRTDFGTLTFEQGADGTTDEKSRVKILRLKEGESYDVQINGTGRGIMNYTIGFMDEDGQYSDMREFRNIKINKNTVIDTVADTGRTTTLKVDEDGDGKYDIRYRAGENERAEEVNDTWIYVIVSVAVLAMAAAAVIVLKVKKNKKNKKEEGN